MLDWPASFEGLSILQMMPIRNMCARRIVHFKRAYLRDAHEQNKAGSQVYNLYFSATILNFYTKPRVQAPQVLLLQDNPHCARAGAPQPCFVIHRRQRHLRRQTRNGPICCGPSQRARCSWKSSCGCPATSSRSSVWPELRTPPGCSWPATFAPTRTRC